ARPRPARLRPPPPAGRGAARPPPRPRSAPRPAGAGARASPDADPELALPGPVELTEEDGLPASQLELAGNHREGRAGAHQHRLDVRIRVALRVGEGPGSRH